MTLGTAAYNIVSKNNINQMRKRKKNKLLVGNVRKLLFLIVEQEYVIVVGKILKKKALNEMYTLPYMYQLL
jgi:ribosomal protein L18E